MMERVDLESLYMRMSEDSLENILWEHREPFIRSRVLLRAYALFKDYSYFKRALNELEKLSTNIVFGNLKKSLSMAFNSEEFSSLISMTSIEEALQSFSPSFREEPSGAYLLYLYSRLKGNHGEALDYLRRASSLGVSFGRELSYFTLMLAYRGKFRVFSNGEIEEKELSVFPREFNPQPFSFSIPIPFYSYGRDFVDFALRFYCFKDIERFTPLLGEVDE